MILRKLIKDMDVQRMGGNLDIEISGIAYDSRKVKEGDLFVAMKGEKFNGHDFINDAIKKGAVAIVYEHDISDFGFRPELDSGSDFNSTIRNQQSTISFISVRDSRKALAYISNNFYGKPSDKLTVIGITGTNGKTTTTYLIKSILESWGKEVGLIGTINYLIKNRVYVAPHTTPEALEFHGLLSEMLSSNCSHVVTEVSSHALSQKRVDYANFNVAVFTNLTREHLDFHITMENYFDAKKRLFEELLSDDGAAVINLDNSYGKILYEIISRKSQRVTDKSESRITHHASRTLTYGLEKGADVVAVNIKNSSDGLSFKIEFKGESYDIESSLMGVPNVYNILSAVGTAIALNVPWDVIRDGIKRMGHVTGRFEKVDIGQDFLAIVDYAHTEDALERLILTANEIKKQQSSREAEKHYTYNASRIIHRASRRIITVFGCGGDRDRGKRPRMGDIATRLSDYVVITSDNPRSEDPLEIIKEIEYGVSRRNYLIMPDRKEAIEKAVEMADAGDIVLVAGKGHEDYQEIEDVRHIFRDRDVLEEAIKSRFKNSDT